MENNPWLIVIIVGVIAVIAGYLFGILDARVTTALKEGREKIVAEEQKPTPKLDEHDVLKVSVDRAIKWHLELDGARIEPDGLTPEQRTRLVNVIVQIRPWIDGKTVASPVPIPVSPATPALASNPALAWDASVPIGTQPAVTSPPRIDIARGFRSILESDVKNPEPAKGPSIVTMIDEVLQKKL